MMVLRQKLGDAKTKSLVARAVYMINVGSNDYLGPLSENSNVIASYSPEKYVDLVIGNITTWIKVCKTYLFSIQISKYSYICYNEFDVSNCFCNV